MDSKSHLSQSPSPSKSSFAPKGLQIKSINSPIVQTSSPIITLPKIFISKHPKKEKRNSLALQSYYGSNKSNSKLVPPQTRSRNSIDYSKKSMFSPQTSNFYSSLYTKYSKEKNSRDTSKKNSKNINFEMLVHKDNIEFSKKMLLSNEFSSKTETLQNQSEIHEHRKSEQFRSPLLSSNSKELDELRKLLKFKDYNKNLFSNMIGKSNLTEGISEENEDMIENERKESKISIKELNNIKKVSLKLKKSSKFDVSRFNQQNSDSSSNNNYMKSHIKSENINDVSL